MKYIKQLLVILFISFVGEILHYFIPLPIPASIYGIVIMFACLYFKVIKVEQIKETAKFLIEIMPVMFIPAAVGLMNSWDIIKPSLLIYSFITFASTVIVMAVTGLVAQFIVGKKGA